MNDDSLMPFWIISACLVIGILIGVLTYQPPHHTKEGHTWKTASSSSS